MRVTVVGGERQIKTRAKQNTSRGRQMLFNCRRDPGRVPCIQIEGKPVRRKVSRMSREEGFIDLLEAAKRART